MIIPLWAILGFVAAFFSAATMLLQEKRKVDGFVLAIWTKIACVLATLPFVLFFGFPDNPHFYILLCLQAIIFAIADVIWFKQIPHVGAGVISRLFPITVITSFLLWFLFEPSMVHQFIDQPVIGSLIIFVLALAVYFAVSLKKCSVSSNALKKIWFVLLANTTGPIIAKLLALNSNAAQGPWAYLFVEGLMMLGLWSLYIFIRKPIPWGNLVKKDSCQSGLIIGFLMVIMVYSYVIGFYYIDNPGYLGAVRLLDAVIIIAFHKYIGKRDESNLRAGFGIVACAVFLIILKSYFETG